jgi:hypothetical protein
MLLIEQLSKGEGFVATETACRVMSETVRRGRFVEVRQ